MNENENEPKQLLKIILQLRILVVFTLHFWKSYK